MKKCNKVLSKIESLDNYVYYSRNDLIEMSNDVKKIKARVTQCEIALIVIAIYLIVWLVGWTMGCW